MSNNDEEKVTSDDLLSIGLCSICLKDVYVGDTYTRSGGKVRHQHCHDELRGNDDPKLYRRSNEIE